VDKLPAARLRKSGSKVIREQQRAELLKSRLLAVHGKWQRQGDVRDLIAERLEDQTPLLGRLAVTLR